MVVVKKSEKKEWNAAVLLVMPIKIRTNQKFWVTLTWDFIAP